jgi:hypothetical protein
MRSDLNGLIFMANLVCVRGQGLGALLCQFDNDISVGLFLGRSGPCIRLVAFLNHSRLTAFYRPCPNLVGNSSPVTANRHLPRTCGAFFWAMAKGRPVSEVPFGLREWLPRPPQT